MHDNPVPSLIREDLEGATSRVYDLVTDYETHTAWMKCHTTSAQHLKILDDDMLYSPYKYRETEGSEDQQNTIDRAKGIIAKPMPESWYNRRANVVASNDDNEEIERKHFDMSIVADKKPYFMIYVYPHLKKEYDSYFKNVDFKFNAIFRMHLNDLNNVQNKRLSKEEKTFLDYYDMLMPVGVNPCVVNRISWIFEGVFNGYLQEINSTSGFDYNMLKSDTEYSQKNYNDIKKIYNEYLVKVDEFKKRQSVERIEDPQSERRKLIESFKQECELICTNENELCNIVLDLCYKTENSKQFAWDICGCVFIKNLLKRKKYIISYPELNDSWDFKYMGFGFAMNKIIVNEEDIK